MTLPPTPGTRAPIVRPAWTLFALTLIVAALPRPSRAEDQTDGMATATATCETLVAGSGTPEDPAPEDRRPKRTMTTFGRARIRIGVHRALIDQHLNPVDQTRLQNALDWGSRTLDDASRNSPELDVLNQLFERAFVTMVERFNHNLPAVRRELEAKRALAETMDNYYSANRIRKTLDTLHSELAVPNLEIFLPYQVAVDWARARKLVSMSPVVTRQGAIDRPIEEVDQLEVLGSNERRIEFKGALELAFRTEASLAREERRVTRARTPQLWIDGCTFIPDLNRALTGLFEDTPDVQLMNSKVALRGRARIDSETVVPIAVLFDPRTRYLTVRPPGENVPGELQYYRLTVDSTGRLIFKDAHLVSGEDLAVPFGQTHFQY